MDDSEESRENPEPAGEATTGSADGSDESRSTRTPGHPARDPDVLLTVYEQTVDSQGRPKETVQIPRYLLPSLPGRFERTWLADVPAGAVGSYRDMDSVVESSHIHEFPGHWELHVDSFNPHYRPVEHALADSELAEVTWDPLTILLVGTLETVDFVSDLTLETSGLGARRTRMLGDFVAQSALRGVLAGLDVVTTE